MLVAAGGSWASDGWQRWAVAKAFVSIELPRAWVEGSQRGTDFSAYDPKSLDGLAISHTDGYRSLNELTSSWLPSLRQSNLKRDPAAQITARRVTLPAGQAERVEIVTVAPDPPHVPVVVREYALVHSHRAYVFSFQFRKPLTPQSAQTISHAAYSIRLVG